MLETEDTVRDKRQPMRMLVWLLAVSLYMVGSAGAFAGNEAVLKPREGRLFPEPVSIDGFSLTNHRGKPFTAESLQGKWSIVFFGYTSCSDICPTTLAAMDRVYQALSQSPLGVEDTRFVFVSVDPYRDTPERLNEYVPFFNPVFIGATGSAEQVDQFARLTGARYGYQERSSGKKLSHSQMPPPNDEYIVGHVSDLFLFDTQGRLVGYIYPPVTSARVAALYTAIREAASRTEPADTHRLMPASLSQGNTETD